MRKSFVGIVALVAVAAMASSAGATFPGPDGRIIFEQDNKIVAIDPDGTDLVPLANDPSDYLLSPSCSANGNLITFSGQSTTPAYDIWVMRIDGSNRHRVTDDATEDSTPAFSPNGKLIAFSRDNGTNFDIWTMGRSGGKRHKLLGKPGNQLWPRYSPDGKRIAFVHEASGGNGQIWVMNADGTKPHAIVKNGFDNDDLSWSPNGRRITYIEDDFGGDQKIVSVTPAGKKRKVLQTAVTGINIAVLSPRGKRLAITDGGAQDLYVQPLGGSPVDIADNASFGALDWCVRTA